VIRAPLHGLGAEDNQDQRPATGHVHRVRARFRSFPGCFRHPMTPGSQVSDSPSPLYCPPRSSLSGGTSLVFHYPKASASFWIPETKANARGSKGHGRGSKAVQRAVDTRILPCHPPSSIFSFIRYVGDPIFLEQVTVRRAFRPKSCEPARQPRVLPATMSSATCWF